ncbi:class III poly(R)-hydroxyalkanoic acid synthase subunit PhaC [Ectothiorhodospira sp. BSL-9]|uniref:class III poly(R)-hydroxyalkanoic acid synthase subunit PhaC n=1 Tax=Ectothiorhodospira sp. BSL-9 TaxID=1442136 RepID=UPI0007B434C2|nr:class III poly(R)-hydroxyalkanoic acid synthase subunit PhaC [Ectothiorhodospira sp. BSL-9]ANB02480.1 poly-beta-hydroxybutyrate polymerase [Ectothiorhodospira sp. BSL-9]TVQ73360.1 MAG: class III poly(R)-hydroxyalkanoic acid synthase subunit PhaC [Chromatiaceae bacterium]
MIPIQIRPDQVLDEISTFQKKLTTGLQNLAEADDIPSGVTPKEAVYREDKLTLYRFQPSTSKVQNPVPVLIVYALVNRPYMTDLQENRSTVQGLLDAGMDVYLIDWGYPDRADRFLTMDDYLNGYVDRCVDEIRWRHGIDKVNLLGICQGGTFSLCYSAMNPEKVQNLITMVTPVDFHTPGNILAHWVKHVDIDTLVDTMGNIPGELLNWTFLNLKPYQLMGQKYLDMVEVLQDKDKLDNFLRMEKWIFDSPDQAGETYRQFIKDFYQQNKLMNGGLHIGDHEVDLANVTMPVLNIFAEQDHLVPPDASKALAKKVGTKDYTELSFPGGHIGIYVSGKAQKMVPPAIGKWVDERTEK